MRSVYKQLSALLHLHVEKTPPQSGFRSGIRLDDKSDEWFLRIAVMLKRQCVYKQLYALLHYL